VGSNPTGPINYMGSIVRLFFSSLALQDLGMGLHKMCYRAKEQWYFRGGGEK